jgi:hypothetical protein
MVRAVTSAAAVKCWGKNSAILGTRAGLPHPPKPAVALMAPTRAVGARTGTIAKLDKARGADQVQSADNGDGAGPSTLAESTWDEDDVMLFFWGNTKAATERHAARERERERNIHEWREGTVA